MCNYCKKTYSNDYKTEDHADWQMTEYKGKWTLEMETEYEEYRGCSVTVLRELTIEYCPFCGRKLEEVEG